jgi:hypothetical protein
MADNSIGILRIYDPHHGETTSGMLRSVTGADEVFFTARRSLPTRFGRNPASR